MNFGRNTRERKRERISVSILKAFDAEMRRLAEDEGTSISEQYERAVALYLEERQAGAVPA